MEGNRGVITKEKMPSHPASYGSSTTTSRRLPLDEHRPSGDAGALRERLIAATVDAIADGSVARLTESR
jgi:hypothetical protein